MEKNKFLNKYKRCVMEYAMNGAYQLEEDDNMQQGGMGQAMGGAEGGMDPAMGGAEGGMDPAMGGAEGGMDPAMGDAEGGMDPAMGGAEGGMDPATGGVEGFNPEGADMGAEAAGGMNPEDEVIDVDDLTKSQEAAEEKIDKMNAKFEKLMGAVETLVKQNAERDAKAAEAEARLRAELEKRIPTPQQKMTMRSTKSSPYSMTPNEYMNNYAPENYSDEDDNNGADDAQYKITKDDIDRFTDYDSIVRDLDVEHQGLHDILGL